MYSNIDASNEYTDYIKQKKKDDLTPEQEAVWISYLENSSSYRRYKEFSDMAIHTPRLEYVAENTDPVMMFVGEEYDDIANVFLERNGYSINGFKVVNFNGKRVVEDDIIKRVSDIYAGFNIHTWLFLKAKYLAKRVTRVRSKAFVDSILLSLDSMKRESHRTLTAQISKELSYNNTGAMTNLEKFVQALSPLEDHRAVLYAIAHWMQQVKRNMLSKEIQDHIALVIVGEKHGSGKSVAVEKLVNPLKGLQLGLGVLDVIDPTYGETIAGHFAVVLDEMAGAGKTDTAALKRRITAKTYTCRSLYKSPEEYENRTSYIGTSNEPLSTLIKDSTGNRRFFQITTNKIDWELINSIDYKAMWKEIDENLESGYRNIAHEEIAKVQKEQVYKDQLTLFAEETNLMDDKNESWVTSQYLYNAYTKWCTDNGEKPVSKNWLTRKLGLVSKVFRDGNKTVIHIMISANSSLTS